MNRLKDFFDSTPEPEGEDNYFIIESLYDTFAVSRETADDVACQLARHPALRWVTFRDLGSAFHRVLAGHVYRLSESTAQQRAASRAFWRARKLEAKADRRPWEDDD